MCRYWACALYMSLLQPLCSTVTIMFDVPTAVFVPWYFEKALWNICKRSRSTRLFLAGGNIQLCYTLQRLSE